ncbi:MAG: hypothetical protein R3B47_09735 [Bacteroidia bacterium]
MGEIFVPNEPNGIQHESLLKVHVHGADGSQRDAPAGIRRAVQDDSAKDFAGQFWSS